MATKHCLQLTSHSFSVLAPSPLLYSQTSQLCLYSLYLPHPSAQYDVATVSVTQMKMLPSRSALPAFSRSPDSTLTLHLTWASGSIRHYWPHSYSNILLPLCLLLCESVISDSFTWSLKIRGSRGPFWRLFKVILFISMTSAVIYTLLTPEL